MTIPAAETVASCMSDSESDEDVFEDESRSIYKEEYRRYHSAVLKSDGFDVPYYPGTATCGIINPVSPSYYATKVRRLAQAAIDHYNNTNGYNYEIVEIIKANQQGCRYTTYYITFSVKSAGSDGPITTFQAKVVQGLPHEALEFEMIRPEPEEHKHLNSLGVV